MLIYNSQDTFDILAILKEGINIEDFVEEFNDPIREYIEEEPDSLIVDRVDVINKNNHWYVIGYLNNIEVIKMGGWDNMEDHVNAVMFDAEGNEVEHTIVKDKASTMSDLEYRLSLVEIDCGRTEYAEALMDSGTLSVEQQSELERSLDNQRRRGGQ